MYQPPSISGNYRTSSSTRFQPRGYPMDIRFLSLYVEKNLTENMRVLCSSSSASSLFRFPVPIEC